jgi:DNA-binding LacI/PurR family transcriptional regulator
LTETAPSRLGKRSTLAAIVDWIGDPYQCSILSGVLEAASAAGATFLCFIGDSLPADPTLSARHRSFELVNRNVVDGLVVLAGTLTHHIGINGLAAYCAQHFGGIPICSVSEALPGVPSVITSNASGIQAVMRHLISVHGRRRLAFVRGPLAQNEAEIRFNAYVTTLAEHDIAYNEQLVFVGNFMAESGYDAVQHFAKVAGPRLEGLDAIVASNDSMAVGLLRGLEERGIAVPGTIAVTGFDDVESAAFANPPITTVRQALARLGRHGARGVLEWARLGTVPMSEEVNTELVVRRSCGCAEANARQQIASSTLNCSFESTVLMQRQRILDSLARAARGQLGSAGRDWQAKLLSAFLSDLGSEASQEFPNFVEDMTEKSLTKTSSARLCREVVDCLRSQLIGALYGDPNRRERADDIFYAAHQVIDKVVSRNMMRERAHLSHLVRSMSVVCNKLSSAQSISHLRESIGVLLPQLNLHNYYVVNYRNRDPRRAELLMARDGAAIDPAAYPSTFDASNLLPPPLLSALDGRAFAVLPLSLREHFLGHLLLELNLEQSYCYDPIADAIASGLHRAELVASSAG